MNRSSYNRIASQWNEARTGFTGRERHYLETLLDGLPVPSSILDAGCGNGRPMAEFVIGRGHRVTGIDQAEELLALARERFPRETWIQARIEDCPFTGRYDGIICWDSLFHIAREHHARILTSLSGVLAPGGRIMLTAGGSDHPPFTDTMFEHEFFYDSFPPARVASFVRDAGFDVLINEFMNLPTSGRDKGRIAIVAQKAAVQVERAAPEDAPAFVAMEQADDARRYVMAYSLDEHLRRMDDPGIIYLRILDRGALAGFFLLALDPDGTSVEFRRIVVATRDRGIGQAAIARMERFCQAELRRRRIWLDVFEDNHRGRHIYEKLGYERFDARDYGDRRLLLYQKALTGEPDDRPDDGVRTRGSDVAEMDADAD